MSDESWLFRAQNGFYLASDAATGSFPMDYAVEGLMPATGATIWYGSGSTGKTQLLLWLAAHIASRGEGAPSHWLGSKIHVRGQVLILTAEDLREHLFERIGMIARSLVLKSNCDASYVAKWTQDICDRIHVVPFLSLSKSEFDDLNPCLFDRRQDGRWGPTNLLEDIEQFLENWNANADAEDRIVGVVLDSAVSMAGFEMTNSEATTNFLFHLNRMSRRQNMFWSVIGHTPKDAAKRSEGEAIERLRGSAMWSTTPRTVIEVRVAGDQENLSEVQAVRPGFSARDVLVVAVAKANSRNADLRPRALLRLNDGAFDDITDVFPSIFRDRQEENLGEQSSSASFDPAALCNAVADLIASITNGGEPSAQFTRAELRQAYAEAKPTRPILAAVSGEVDGRFAKRRLTLAYFLFAFKQVGAIRQRGQNFYIVDLDRARSYASRSGATTASTKRIGRLSE